MTLTSGKNMVTLDLTGMTRPWTLFVLNQLFVPNQTVNKDLNEVLIKDYVRNFRNMEVDIYRARVMASDINFYTQLNNYFEALGIPKVRIGDVNTVYAIRRGVRTASVSAYIYALLKFRQPVIFKDTLNDVVAVSTVRVSFKDCRYERGTFTCKPMYA